jgi:ATP dependent DNA ligase domain
MLDPRLGSKLRAEAALASIRPTAPLPRRMGLGGFGGRCGGITSHRGARPGRSAEVHDLLFGRREPSYVAFDVLFVDGEDVRALPLKERRALLERIVRRHRMQRSEPVLGDGKAAFQAVCDLDLEGIVAKRNSSYTDPMAEFCDGTSKGRHHDFRSIEDRP